MIINNLSDGFREMVLDFYPILEKASVRGIPIDSLEREKLIIYLEQTRTEIYNSIQSKVSDEVRKIHPPNGYVRVPEVVSELVRAYKVRSAQLLVEGKKVVTLDEFVAKKTYHKIVKAGEEGDIWGKFRFANFSVLNNKTGEETIEGRWCRVEDFNPNSPKQIIRYMKSKGHKVPVKMTGEETSDAKELERLAISTADIMYDQIIEYRQINKMLTNDIPNWEPKDRTGAVHTQFGFLPASGQLNSRNPNVQNANKHKPLGKRFRRIIRARSYRDGRWAGRGRRIVEVDYSGFHAIMLGREAESERYINISKSDAHSWFTSYVIGKPVEYPNSFATDGVARQKFISRLKEIKKEYKVIRDTQSKPTILGVGLGLGPKKMYWMNRPKLDRKSGLMVGIESEKRSKQLQGLLKELLGELFHYQEVIKELAFRQTYLINDWGMIRWFFDVKGEDGEKAIAFNVQGNAHGMLRWVLRKLDDMRVESDEGLISPLDKYYFNNTIHDSLCFEPFEDEVEECIRLVQSVMHTPCKRLANKVCPDGLVVLTEASVGENWAEWDEKENSGGMKVWTN